MPLTFSVLPVKLLNENFRKGFEMIFNVSIMLTYVFNSWARKRRKYEI